MQEFLVKLRLKIPISAWHFLCDTAVLRWSNSYKKTRASAYAGHEFEPRHYHFYFPYNLAVYFFMHNPAVFSPSHHVVPAVDFIFYTEPWTISFQLKRVIACCTSVRAPVRNMREAVFLASVCFWFHSKKFGDVRSCIWGLFMTLHAEFSPDPARNHKARTL